MKAMKCILNEKITVVPSCKLRTVRRVLEKVTSLSDCKNKTKQKHDLPKMIVLN